MSSSDNLDELINKEYTYPSPDDPELQSKIYNKREFYSHKISKRPDIKNYQDIKELRDDICAGHFSLHEHQAFLSNLINPDTPYSGILVFHGTGSGKTCAAITVCEKFKDMVQRYGTKIYILHQGPLLKENWKNEILKCTGETYLKYHDKTILRDENELNKDKKNALNLIKQYYQFMSYSTFYKKVLGEKIKDNITQKARKTKTGEYERDIAVDKITNLNNSIIIVEEAHNLTENNYGDALKKIIKASSNLRVILLTATPMKNKASDFVELINFIRPQNSLMYRDRIFTSDQNYKMEFKPGGKEYLKNMSRGYVSYLRGADPITYAKRVEKGEIPNGLLFTKLIRCEMAPFQKKAYKHTIETYDDTLDRKSEAIANFAFPGLSEDKKSISAYLSNDGLDFVVNQLKVYQDKINTLIAKDILKEKDDDSYDLMYVSENGKNISGDILNIKYLKHFSTKFYYALKNLNKLVDGEKGSRTAFVYCNLVKTGIELFEEVLKQNGYLEYQEDYTNYNLVNDTRCYYCGKNYKDHKGHEFHPATYLTVTGQSADEAMDSLPEEKNRILKDVFNNLDNNEGKLIKLILGSQVINEGLSLQNVAEVHILDVYYNLGRVDQVIGRAIRWCSHYTLMNEKNKFPEVEVYKYSIKVDKGLSTEEELYRKAEKKHILVKKVERVLKKIAIDCPLNMSGNVFNEEIEMYKNCGEKGQDACPAICDYMKCEYQCEDKILNNKYYDPKRKIYRDLSKEDLDVSTFTHSLARSEINYIKDLIKEMYKTKFAYLLNNIIKYVKHSYKDNNKDLFDKFFVYKALDELIPITENDFNNFHDTIIDKFNRPGYIIYIDKYYIFQPDEQNQNVPMYYRSTYSKPIINKLSLYNYLKNKPEYKNFMNKKSKYIKTEAKEEDISYYNFNDVIDYYYNRKEYDYVGIIDKEASRRKTKRLDDLKDVFKIREKLPKIIEKKRGTGIPSLKGAVCATSKTKEYLEDIAKGVNIDIKSIKTRTDLCNAIKRAFLSLEKYSTGKNKKTYIIIPSNHNKYPFPFNLEDRADFIKHKLEDKANVTVTIKEKNKTYTLTLSDNNEAKKIKDDIKIYKGKLKDKKWTIVLE